MTDTELRTALNRCAEYDVSLLKEILTAQFEALDIGDDFFKGKNVVIKPNLVPAIRPEAAATVHPAVVEAAAEIITDRGGKVTLAESPGGLYTAAVLHAVYSQTGMDEAAGRVHFTLNYDTSSRSMNAPHGQASHEFEIITPICDADVIVDISKLKAHTLTLISNSAKNLFGCVPGTTKAAYHARFRNQTEFQRSLVDLAQALYESKPMLCITDAITCMEGNGPTGGNPIKGGCIFSSLNPFAADVLGAHIIGLTEDGVVADDVKMTVFAAERGLTVRSVKELEIIGDSPDDFVIGGFTAADTRLKKWFDRIPSWLSPRPEIDAKICVGCGRCASVCPPKAVAMKDRLPHIDRSVCVRCFCCQELCPHKAVKIHKNIILKIIK